MRVLFHIFSLGAAQTPVAISAHSARKAPKNPAKREFLVPNKVEVLEFKLEKLLGFRNIQEKFENIVIPSENVHTQSNFSSPHDISPFYCIPAKISWESSTYIHTLYLLLLLHYPSNGKRRPY